MLPIIFTEIKGADSIREYENGDYISILTPTSLYSSSTKNKYTLSTYTRGFLPVIVRASSLHWVYIEDWEGVLGWVKSSKVADVSSFIITSDFAPVYNAPNSGSGIRSMIYKDVNGIIVACDNGYCLLKSESDSIYGWVMKKDFFGPYIEKQ